MKTDPKYIKPEKKFKADRQIDMFGQVLKSDFEVAHGESKDSSWHMSETEILTERPPPRRHGKAICKAKLDALVSDESANRCAGLRSEKVSETDERVVYDTDENPIRWTGEPVYPTLQRHKGYAQATVQRGLTLQEVGCEFPSSPTRHRCLEGKKGEPAKAGGLMFRGPSEALDGFRQHKRNSAAEDQGRSHFVIG
jgi:hypothetical protein